MATDRPRFLQLYATPKMGVLASLGFAGGLPNVLVTAAAIAWVSDAGWSVPQIGTLTALANLPYALKFLWAPALDRFNAPLLGRMGRRRGWLMFTQLSLIGAIALVAVMGGTMDPAMSAVWIGLVVLMAVMSATYDIVSDAYRADILQAEELGAGASVFVTGYRLALVVAGAGVMMLAKGSTWERFSFRGWGWPNAWLGAALLLGVGVIAIAIGREPARTEQPAAGFAGTVLAPVQVFWRAWRERLAALAAFVLVFRLPDQMGNAMSLPFLIQRMKFDVGELALIRQGLGLGFTVIGALIGGWLVARWGIMRCLLLFGVLQAATNVGYMGLSLGFDSGALAPLSGEFCGGSTRIASLAAVLVVENFAGGMVAAGFVAFLMSLCDHRYTAAQYALLSALVALGATASSWISGRVEPELGWTAFFGLTIAAGAPGLLLLLWVRPPAPVEGELIGAGRSAAAPLG